MNSTKSFEISKRLVMEAYRRVKANKGAAGVDDQSIQEFEENLKDNLYKLWNRMSSGSYFPSPVRLVEIPKSGGGTRTLGIPTVTDRVAQMVGKLCLEPTLEPIFHQDSYGYRPGRSALHAVGKARQLCFKQRWVIDLDIKGFFDNINHDLLMKAVEKHTDVAWLKLYIQRWLTTPMVNPEGVAIARDKGTPQGGVISPLLANLYLHYAFDYWMSKQFPDIQFERYADDIVIHSRTERQAQFLKQAIESRLLECHLESHPDKTQVVYCHQGRGKSRHKVTFDFLGYGFKPRLIRNRDGKFRVGYTPSISKKAMNSIRERMRKWELHKKCNRTIVEIAEWINPVLQGWINYYGQYQRSELHPLFRLLNRHLAKWVCWKYKRFKNRPRAAWYWLGGIAKTQPTLFAHWKFNKPPTGARRAV